MKKAIASTALVILGLLGAMAAGQDRAIESSFRRISPEEEQRLRMILAAAIPSGELKSNLERFFIEQEAAAVRLGEPDAREKVLRNALRYAPTYFFKNNLAGVLLNKGAIEEGNELRKISVAEANEIEGIVPAASMACDMGDQGRDRTARDLIQVNLNKLDDFSQRYTARYSKLQISRGYFRNYRCLTALEAKKGQWNVAIAAAESAEINVRKAQALSLSSDGPTDRSFLTEELSMSIEGKLQSYRNANRLSDAERALAEYVRLSKEVELPADHLSTIYRVAGQVRFAQREFLQAETYYRKSDAVAASLGWGALDGGRAGKANLIAKALGAQGKWSASADIYNRLDGLAGNNSRLKQRIEFRIDRGRTYLHTGRAAEAAAIFDALTETRKKTYETGHFYLVESSGLQAVALWRTALPENKAKAIPLLKQAVADYMAPANADYLENVDTRKEVRELIFATYLEALATTPGEDATQSLGPADWVRGGVVQDALADAAVRSAASNAALSDIVRREQDAKNEINGLRKYLAGETGGAASPPPEIAVQMRARIAELETARQGLQAQIKASFPDYERLVRPTAPTVVDIAKGLAADEALLMLLPTEDAVYVWAVPSSGTPAFARVALPQAELAALVRDTRRSLDFAQMGGRVNPFNAKASSELYQRLLLPVQSAFQGKKQLVIAAGGVLSQLPFGVLLTQPTQMADADSPWLIKQAAVTQVPSVSAWLAVKQFAKAKPATEPLMGWGDPLFAAKAAVVASSGASALRKVVLTRASTVVDLEKEDPRSALRYADIPSLPETRDELLAIANTLQANPSKDLRLGEQATKQSVLQASQSGELLRKRVLVFATHGLMAGDLPNLNQPALALAATGQETTAPLGALLTLEDVLSLKLNADWVVLSACNTAAADGKAEEALSGLARGFFYAGSRSLLVTHWAVESDSAKMLTTSTFEHYTQNPNAPKAESLRQAMLKVMAKPEYSHPAFWAPYALVGDGGR